MTGRLIILCLAAIMFPHAAVAQTISLLPTHPKRWDTNVAIGWLAGNKEAFAGEWDDWYDTFVTTVEIGRYWTPHIKTEAAVAVTTEGGLYSHEQFAIPGQPFPVFFSREHQFRVRTLNLSAAYQALENSWVHPLVGAGVQLAWERHRIETPFPTAFSRDGRGPFVVPAPDREPGAELRLEPFVTGGAKFYVMEHGFIRSDLSAAFDGRSVSRVWWRIGGGIDF